jgi:hypothetical protein
MSFSLLLVTVMKRREEKRRRREVNRVEMKEKIRKSFCGISNTTTR